MMKHFYILTFFCLLFGNIQGQVVEQLSPQERKQFTKVTEPITLYKGFLRLGISSHFSTNDKMFDKSGNKKPTEGSVSSTFFLSIFSLQYGITDRLELEAGLPYVRGTVKSSYIRDTPFHGERSKESYSLEYTGFSDPFTLLRYQIIEEGATTPGVTLGAVAYWPIGKSDVTDYKNPQDYNPPVAKGELGLGVELKIRKVAYPLSYEVGAIYQKYMGADKILIPEQDRIHVVSGPEYTIRPAVNFHLNEWVLLTHYGEYYRATKDDFVGQDLFSMHNNEFDQWALRYYPGITFQVKRLRLEQAVMIPLAGKVMSADPYYFFIVQYVF